MTDRAPGLAPLAVVPTIADILRARIFLAPRVRRTPLEPSPALSELVGVPVFLKCENLQRCGSFKIRGSLYRMEHLSPEERRRGVVTASSGNHGQGVALAAATLGVAATVVVPQSCPETKRAAIRHRGKAWVELRVTEGLYDDAEREAHRLAEQEGRCYISSFEDRFVAAGAGTVGWEILEEEPALGALVSPLGGGGLLSGIAVASRALGPDMALWGVTARANPCWARAWDRGRMEPVEDEKESLAEGLAGTGSRKLYPFLRETLSGVRSVTEDDIARAMALLHRAHHLVVEGAGAVGVAALLTGVIPLSGPVAVVLTGGNVDEEPFLEALKRGTKRPRAEGGLA
ncbi:MAG: L-threonine dehydratase catabolic TdcB [Synergistetes bacterium ADurb.Bin520]|nr:MAG: L-threonine dehydratase catabolic TdcB [Synergistetes bacterium ADurb.Bin520]